MGVKLDLKGIGELVTGAGTLAKDIRSAITGEISPEKKAELETKALELEAATMQAQMAINQEEAKSSNIFISGARPMIMWVGCFIILFEYIIAPLLRTFGAPVPVIEMGDLWPVITGLLGLGGMRTYEKAKDVVHKH